MNIPKRPPMRGGFRMRSDGNLVVNSRDINCPYVADCDRISRGDFLRMAGVGAAAVGAGAMGMSTLGMSGVVNAQTPPQTVVTYMGPPDRTTLGNWFNEVPGDKYGNCAYILGAMCATEDHTELQVTYGYHGFDIFGGQLFPCLDYAVYTCKNALACDDRTLLTDGSHRRASCWFNNGTQDVTLNIPDTGRYRLAVYAVDFDTFSRNETITVIQGASPSRQIPSSPDTDFHNGTYAVFDVDNGSVTISISQNGGANAVISGIFLDQISTTPGGGAVFIGEDKTTKGSWIGVYGNYWHLLCNTNDPLTQVNYPWNLYNSSGGASVTYNNPTQGINSWAWTDLCTIGSGCNVLNQDKDKNISFAWSWGQDSTGFGLDVPPNSGCEHVVGAASWASCYDDGGENFTSGPDLYVDLTLPLAGQCGATGCYWVSFYATDYDSHCRKQVIEVYDPVSGQLLANSDPLEDIIGNGVYHTFWMPGGSYLIKIKRTGCTNAILSGIFVNCVPCPAPCTKTIGYYKNHSWNGRTVTICGVTINETIGRGTLSKGKNNGMLWNANSTNFSMLVAQLMAALLNTGGNTYVLIGPSVTIQTVLNWLCAQPGIVVGGSLAWNKAFSNITQKQTATYYSGLLDLFNNSNECD